jgi:hypothetical protein
MWHRSFPYQDHGEEVEKKTRKWRKDKELKSKQEDQDQEKRSQEDKSDKPHDLEFIHPTSQVKPKFSLETIC